MITTTNLITILENNGLEEALLGLKGLEGYDKEIRLFAVACARRAQHLHQICKQVLDVAERYANGLASKEESDAVATTAWRVKAKEKGVAWAITSAALAAVWNEKSMAWVVADEAARAVAWFTAGEVEMVDERRAIWKEEREYQTELFRQFFGGATSVKVD